MTELFQYRNIGIAAHIDAGKTTLSERILVTTGKERRVGRVDEGTAVLDWMEQERERGITIVSAATSVYWQEHLVQLIDTPGHVDFSIEVERCMRVLDGGVLVLDAIEGVQAQTDTVWRQMEKRGLPVLGFVNKCERPGADFLKVADDVHRRLGMRAVAVQYPVELDGQLVGVADLVEQRMAVLGGGGEVVDQEIPEHAREEVQVLRMELVEALAELPGVDDEDAEGGLLEAAVSGVPVPNESLRRALRKAVLQRQLLPLFAGSALKGLGVAGLLDGVVRYLPSPLDRPAIRGLHPQDAKDALHREPNRSAPLAALAFKLGSDSHGESTFVRIYSGSLGVGEHVYNPRTQKSHRISEIRRVHADHFERLDEVGPGDIVVLRGPSLVASGDTLCSEEDPIVLESLELPEPVISRILEPQNAEERDALRQALVRLTHEDLGLRMRELGASGQFALEGMGSLHLEIQVSRLRLEFHLEPRVGDPQVSYRESVLSKSSATGEVQADMGGKTVQGKVSVCVEGVGFGPSEVRWAPGVPPLVELEEALLAELESGTQMGFPILGARVTVESREPAGLDAPGPGELEPVESVSGGPEAEASRSALAPGDLEGLVLAGQKALAAALGSASMGWLEPVVSLGVSVPEEFRGGLLADLGARGADIDLVQSEVGRCRIEGIVPLALMFGYSTEVRSLSQGRATFSMHPAGHRPVASETLAARGLVL